MKDNEKSPVMMKVEKIIGEDAIVVTIPAWNPQQKVVVSAEHFPEGIHSHKNFDDVWYMADVYLKARSVGDLDIRNIRPAPSPIPNEEFAL